MAVKQKRRSGKKSITIPVAVVLGFAPLAKDIWTQASAGNWGDAGKVFVHNMIGWNNFGGGNQFDTQGFGHGLYPVLGGLAVHKVIGGMLGVNKMLSRAHVPFIRI